MPNELNPFLSNPGASPWIVTAPGPGLTRHLMKKQGRMQLMSEAATLTPDQQDLVKQLTEHELSPADSAKYGGWLSEGLRDFAGKYNDNPFYAFSREGKEKVAALQRLVRDPKLAASSQAFKKSQEDYKKIENSHLNDLMKVHAGKISVIDTRDGSTTEILPEQFDPSKYQIQNENGSALTLKDLYNYKTHRTGFHHNDISKIQPIEHAMKDPTEVLDEVNKWYSNLGHTQQEFDNMASGIKITGKNNDQQIQSVLNGLTQDTGLSTQAKNTIYSQYYTNAINDGQLPTSQGAKQALAKYLYDIAKGKNVFEQGTDVSTKLQAEHKKMGVAQDKMIAQGLYSAQATGQTGNQVLKEYNNPNTGVKFNYSVRVIGKEPMFDSNARQDPEKGEASAPKTNLQDLKISRVIDPQFYYVQSPKTGKLVQIPQSLRALVPELVADHRGSLYDLHTRESNQPGTRDISGDPSEDDANAQADRTYSMPVMFQAGRSGGAYDGAESFLNELGVEKTEVSSDEIDQYRKNLGVDTADGSPWSTKLPFVNDKMYKFPIYVVYKDPAIIDKALENLAPGYEPRSRKDVQYIQSSDAKQGSGDQLGDGNAFVKKVKSNQFLGIDALKKTPQNP